MTVASCDVGQMVRAGTPLDSRRSSQTERSLVVNEHTIGDVSQRNDIDVVGRVLVSRLHSGSLDQTSETLAIAIDRVIDPIANGDSGSLVGEALVHSSAVNRRTGIGGGG